MFARTIFINFGIFKYVKEIYHNMVLFKCIQQHLIRIKFSNKNLYFQNKLLREGIFSFKVSGLNRKIPYL